MLKTAIRNRFDRIPLAREILIALILKCALLYALWWAFFSHAPDKRVIAGAVAQHLAGSDSRSSTTPRSPRHD